MYKDYGYNEMNEYDNDIKREGQKDLYGGKISTFHWKW